MALGVRYVRFGFSICFLAVSCRSAVTIFPDPEAEAPVTRGAGVFRYGYKGHPHPLQNLLRMGLTRPQLGHSELSVTFSVPLSGGGPAVGGTGAGVTSGVGTEVWARVSRGGDTGGAVGGSILTADATDCEDGVRGGSAAAATGLATVT